MALCCLLVFNISMLPLSHFNKRFESVLLVKYANILFTHLMLMAYAELSKKHCAGENVKGLLRGGIALSSATIAWLASSQVAYSSTDIKINPVYEVGELFELGIQLSYVLLLLALLGVGTFYVIRQVLVRRELDLSAKELQVSFSF